MCVGIENTVLANCETPFGNSNKFLYIQLTAASAPSLPSPLTKPWRPPAMLFAFFIASAISGVVILPAKGLGMLAASGSLLITSSILTDVMPVFFWFTPSLKAFSSFQKNPLPPAACTSSFFNATLFKYSDVLATEDRLVIPLNIEYLGSWTSPNNSLSSFGGNLVSFISALIKSAPGFPSIVLLIYSLNFKALGLPLRLASLRMSSTIILASFW